MTERFLGIVGVSKSKKFLRSAWNKSSFRDKSSFQDHEIGARLLTFLNVRFRIKLIIYFFIKSIDSSKSLTSHELGDALLLQR